MRETKKLTINPYILVILSFLFIILTGSVLLCTPWARTDNAWGWSSYIDQLFAATSATCVTGLSAYQDGIAGEFTITGQIIMLLMIQIGGLGFITVLTFLLTLFKKKLQFKDRYILSQAVNSTSIADVAKFVRKIIIITGIVETIGFLLGLPVWYQICKGDVGLTIWNSIFTSISAFNNAGFDVIGSTSFVRTGILADISYGWYIYLLIYTMILIIIGGLSFLVILDVFTFKRRPSQWRSFTKIVFLMTGSLLIAGFLLFLLFDVILEKNGFTVLDAVFQSVTCRTAGFASFPQENLSTIGKVISCLLMFVGGSPLSTAGGIKLTTIFMIVLSMVAYFRGKPVAAFKRRYSNQMVIKAMSLLLISLVGILIGFLVIDCLEEKTTYIINGEEMFFRKEDLFFEVFSAFGTTGLSTTISTNLSIGSKIVMCCLMFLGRLGPMTFFQIFQTNITKDYSMHYEYVEEDFLIG